MNDKGVFKSQAIFDRLVKDAVRSLWGGEITTLVFLESMSIAVSSQYEEAWTLGARECGILPSDRSPEEAMKLQQAIQNDLQWLYRFASVIQDAGFKSRQDPNAPKSLSLKSMLDRASLWTNRYREVKNLARAMSCGNVKYVWRLGPTEHCEDCLKYAGQVHRASAWAYAGAIPQGQALACGGFRCRCALVRTDAPAQPGPVSWPSGRTGGMSQVLPQFGGPSTVLDLFGG
jgi:hypothetical protein